MGVPAYGEGVATVCDYPTTTDKTKRCLSTTSLLFNDEHGATTKIHEKILASQRGQPYKVLCSFAMAVNADMAFLELIRDLLSDGAMKQYCPEALGRESHVLSAQFCYRVARRMLNNSDKLISRSPDLSGS